MNIVMKPIAAVGRLMSIPACAVMATVAGSMAAGGVSGLSLPGDEIIIEPDNPVADAGFTTNFGQAVALDRDVLVVGAPLDDVDPGVGAERGAVYVFQRIGDVWTQQARLIAPDGTDGDRFGQAVDIRLGLPGLDDFLIVGAPRANRFSAGPDGRAYVFRRGEDCAWVFDTQLFPNPATDAAHSSEFGAAVAIDASVPADSQTGDPAFTAAVGSPRYEHPVSGGQDHGALHIYQLVGSPAGWQLTHEFYGHDPDGGQNSDMQLGTSVALDGGLIVAGAQIYFASEYQSGAGFLYSRGNQQPGGHFNWSEASRLQASPATTEQQDWLGRSAAIRFDKFDRFAALLGAPFHDGFGFASNSGAVYVFDVFDAGLVRTEVQLLKPLDDAPGNRFGESVAVDRRLAVIGAPGADVGNLDGAVYLFEQTTSALDSWVQVAKLSPSDLSSGFGFQDVGAGAAIAGFTTAYGAPRRSGLPNDPEGAVYLNEFGPMYADGFEGTARRCTVPSP